jgi:hypothetical protein
VYRWLTGFNADEARCPLYRGLMPANDLYETAGELTVAQLMTKIYKIAPHDADDGELEEEAHMFQRELGYKCAICDGTSRGCLQLCMPSAFISLHARCCVLHVMPAAMRGPVLRRPPLTCTFCRARRFRMGRQLMASRPNPR